MDIELNEMHAPPVLRRRPSTSAPNQESEGTCSYHANTRLILHNRFTFLLPRLDVDASQCNLFLQTETVEKYEAFLSLISKDRCSPIGYEKIILFLYVYFLYKTKFTCGANIDDVDVELNNMQIPKIMGGHSPQITSLLTEMNVENKLNFKWIHYFIRIHEIDPGLLFSIIKKMTDLNFYVKLGITRHAMIITRTEGNTYIVKNSWGKLEDVVDMDLRTVKINGDTYRGTSITVYIPISDEIVSFGRNVLLPTDYSKFNTWIDLYSDGLVKLVRRGAEDLVRSNERTRVNKLHGRGKKRKSRKIRRKYLK